MFLLSERTSGRKLRSHHWRTWCAVLVAVQVYGASSAALPIQLFLFGDCLHRVMLSHCSLNMQAIRVLLLQGADPACSAVVGLCRGDVHHCRHSRRKTQYNRPAHWRTTSCCIKYAKPYVSLDMNRKRSQCGSYLDGVHIKGVQVHQHYHLTLGVGR